MTNFDAKQVCLNGHHITDRAHTGSYSKAYCPDCGEPTITECPECGGMIEGEDLDSNVAVIGFEPSVPEHCDDCGEPYPWADSVAETEKEETKMELTPIPIVRKICRRFPAAAYHLQSEQRHGGRNGIEINDEHDVQDILHSFLRLYFEDVRPEEAVPSHAGSASRIDFLLRNHRIGIEVKMTRKGLNDSELGDELSTDKERYQSHPHCDHLICFVYDPDRMIMNQAELSDLEMEEDDFTVEVIVSPSR